MTNTDATNSGTILFIDTNERDQTTVGWLAKRRLTVLCQPVRAQELPTMIEQLLNKVGRSIETVETVAVVNHSGSMTGARIGATYANTWHWLTGRPIFTTPTWPKSGQLKSRQLRPVKIVKPLYQPLSY